MTEEKRSFGRLRFLDGLRGVAVLLVVFSHFMEDASLFVIEVNKSFFQIGQCGVALFFLISGYIIPKSLGASGSLKIFWLHRFFRLYPIYWLTIISAIFLYFVGYFKLPGSVGLIDVLKNFTMLQGLLGSENVVGVFWSLKFEMIFYFSMSLMVVAGIVGRPFLVVLLYSVFVIFVSILMRFFMGRYFSYGFFHLELMFVGWVVGEWHSGKVATNKVVGVFLLSCFSAFLAAYTAFWGREDLGGVGALSFAPMLAAWLFSLVLFFVAVVTSKIVVWPSWLAMVGKISYSIYLLHTLVLAAAVTVFSSHSYFISVLSFLVTLVVSWFTYLKIELPSIAVGKKIADGLFSDDAEMAK